MDVRQGALLVALLVGIGIVVFVYHTTFQSIVEKWDSDASFSHGYLILPISLWLVWRARFNLMRTAFRPTVFGCVAVLICVLAWIVARGAGVLVIEQLAAVALIPSLALAALGWPATRVLLVPLGFLMFMVPFGSGLVPLLMQATATVSTTLLQWTGIPVLRSYMYITIPYGQFEVARACSGINYFVTSLVLGLLYAYINYRMLLKRILCVAAFVAFPVALNILRVYIIVLVSYLTEFQFGPGMEHIVFGRVFFLVVIFALFWIGRRWQDVEPMEVTSIDAGTMPATAPWTRWWLLPLACVLACAGPPFLTTSIAQARAQLSDVDSLITFPTASDGWSGPEDAASHWRPHYDGGLVERQALYRGSQGTTVDVFVAVYGLGATLGAEMISYRNVITPEEFGSLAQDIRRKVDLPLGSAMQVRELIVRDSERERLVWHWYVIGDKPVTNRYLAKAIEALAIVSRSADSARVVTVSTPLDETAQQRLLEFMATYGRCAATGFREEICGQ